MYGYNNKQFYYHYQPFSYYIISTDIFIGLFYCWIVPHEEMYQYFNYPRSDSISMIIIDYQQEERKIYHFLSTRKKHFGSDIEL